MTDRVLTEEEVEAFRHRVEWKQGDPQGEYLDHFLQRREILKVFASHRLQAARIQELEKHIKWLNDCMDEDNADVNAL